LLSNSGHLLDAVEVLVLGAVVQARLARAVLFRKCVRLEGILSKKISIKFTDKTLSDD
jgi:hypothetical protein